MVASFDRIDYSLRIGKYAERRMMADIFRRLSIFGNLEDYEYIGFGSVWFADFILFHRALGMEKMVSIEGEVNSEERVRFNRPYRIDVRMGLSGAVLPNVDWSGRKVAWLDYDDPISKAFLIDVRTFARNAVSGSVLSVSVPCSFAPETRAKKGPIPKAEAFRQRFDDGQVPAKLTEAHLFGWSFGTLARRMFAMAIEDALKVRALEGDKLSFQEICSFEYEDGAKMTTLTGIFYTDEDAPKVAGCGFDHLDFQHEVGRPVRIVNPKLTIKEIRHLEAQLPFKASGPLQHRAIPHEQVSNFVRFYRYFPKFAALES